MYVVERNPPQYAFDYKTPTNNHKSRLQAPLFGQNSQFSAFFDKMVKFGNLMVLVICDFLVVRCFCFKIYLFCIQFVRNFVFNASLRHGGSSVDSI